MTLSSGIGDAGEVVALDVIVVLVDASSSDAPRIGHVRVLEAEVGVVQVGVAEGSAAIGEQDEFE